MMHKELQRRVALRWCHYNNPHLQKIYICKICVQCPCPCLLLLLRSGGLWSCDIIHCNVGNSGSFILSPAQAATERQFRP